MTQEYLGQIQITNSTKDFVLNGGGSGDIAVALTPGTYYIEGYTGEGGQLIEHLQAVIRAANGGATWPAAEVVRAAAGGISIDFDSVTTSVTFTDSALGTLLGFVGNLSPSNNLVELPVDLDTFWGIRSSSMISISRDGSTYGMEGNLLYDGVYRYEALPSTDVIDTSGSVWKTLESFWEAVVHEVRPIRVIKSSGTYAAAGDYVTALMLPGDAESDGEAITIGDFRQYVGRTVDSYNGLWDVDFKLAKYITA
jgi:hypothetical protein